MKYTALIPARGGSKGIPNKNIKIMNGQPLITWSILQAKASKKISRVIVSTDDETIADIARKAGAQVPELRPKHLATDVASTEVVMLHALDTWMKDESNKNGHAMVLLQATSPLRLANSIDSAISLFEQQQADSLVSVCSSHAFFWKNPSAPEPLYDFRARPRRQDIEPKDQQYRENGSIYITDTQLLSREKNRLGGKIAMFQMKECESWEIDSMTDWLIVETMMKEVNL
uniref:acylneuraminate cytidylyltransferase family protein n=1 Tax=Ningiella ruwaisensis TaxID=2364274 RepID=UPI00109FD7C6|nr:acylneuraminate cytidylyltransferase family protein [Ningiella ruwaisensis]